MDVVIRQDICDEEKSYIQTRLQIVGDCLRSHGIECKPDELPRVALLGSGGGQRAQIAFLGVLRQLGQDNLLDCVLYLAGVSGSTWAMASLYADAHWSKNSMEATSRVLNSISEGEGDTFSEGVQWLRKRHEEGDLSLFDPWGVMICETKGVLLETRTLSDEGSRGDGANPYPLYSAIERALFDKGEVKELWCELSPHESGFTEPGAFVKTSLLKQEFEGGRVQYSPKRKPMDMVQLQGICGCVFGDLQFILKYIWEWIKSHLPHESDPTTGVQISQIVMALVELVECTLNRMEGSHEVLAKMKTLLGESHGKLSSTLLELDFEIWTSGHLGDEEKRRCMEKIFEELIDSSEEWGSLNNFKNIFSDVWWVTTHILPLFFKWQSGNVANFLHQFNDPSVPEDMCKRDTMHLIDAGLFLNSPYPSVLRKARDVDVIISFDFSEEKEDEAFKTVDDAQNYAKSNNPHDPHFPHVTDEGRNPLKSFYVYKEKDKPTVIHIPLFNIDNCEDESGVKQDEDAYATFQMTYRDKDKIDHLANRAAKNVKINKDKILNEIREAAERRMAKR